MSSIPEVICAKHPVYYSTHFETLLVTSSAAVLLVSSSISALKVVHLSFLIFVVHAKLSAVQHSADIFF